jgi:hypothetical protein
VTRDDLFSYLRRWVLGKPFVLGAMAPQKQLDTGLTRQRLETLAGLRGKTEKKGGTR